MAADLSEAPLTSATAGALRSGGTSIPLAVRDQVQRTWLGRNTNTLADLFTAPDSVARIRGVLEQGAQSAWTRCGGRCFSLGEKCAPDEAARQQSALTFSIQRSD